MLNGNGALDTSTHRLFGRVHKELTSRRFDRLAVAVREHEMKVKGSSLGSRGQDRELYRRLAEISSRRAPSPR